MASLGHIAVGLAAGRRFAKREATPWSFWGSTFLPMLAFAALALAPDLDVIGFWLGVSYGSEFGHRGAFHSLLAALGIGASAAAIWFALVASRSRKLSRAAATASRDLAPCDLVPREAKPESREAMPESRGAELASSDAKPASHDVASRDVAPASGARKPASDDPQNIRLNEYYTIADSSSMRTLAFLMIWCIAVVATHGLLDTLTDGGRGVALFWPFTLHRYFAPWRPIPVAPIGARMLSARGLHVLLVEALEFAPFLLYATWPRRKTREDR